MNDIVNNSLGRRSFLAGVGLSAGAVALAGCGGGKGVGGESPSSEESPTAAPTGTLNCLFMKQAGYSEADVNKMIKSFTAKYPAVKITPEFVAYEALHDKITAAAPAGTYDVILIDVIWPAEFGKKQIAADVTDWWPDDWKDTMLGGAVLTSQYEDKQYGIPWILDTKYLFYNTAHLSAAKLAETDLDTWDGVLKAAKAIKSSGGPKHPLIWSWKQAEALICDFTQLLAAYGGSFIDGSKVTFNDDKGEATLSFMRQSIVDGLTNPASTQSAEDEVQKVVSAGQASMGLNWTYMYGLANDAKESKVAGKIKCLQTPKGPAGRSSVNGSMALAVAQGSKNKSTAWQFISFLTSEEEQKKYAISSLPCWKTSYDDPAVLKTNPGVVPQAKKSLNDMVLRPTVVQYNQISQFLQVEIQNALLGRKTPKAALDSAAKQVEPLLA